LAHNKQTTNQKHFHFSRDGRGTKEKSFLLRGTQKRKKEERRTIEMEREEAHTFKSNAQIIRKKAKGKNNVNQKHKKKT